MYNNLLPYLQCIGVETMYILIPFIGSIVLFSVILTFIYKEDLIQVEFYTPPEH